ncbi:MAG: polysaccharide biosynthesis tyrosine autokinase [Gemmatimonadota bacterium]
MADRAHPDSNPVLEPVVEGLRLYVRPEDPSLDGMLEELRVGKEFEPGSYVVALDSGRVELRTDEGEVLERVRPGEAVGASRGFTWTPAVELLEADGPVEFSLVPPRVAADLLRGNLDVQMPPHGRFVRIQYSGTEPERLARTVNEVSDQLVVVAAELKGARLEELAVLLKEQLDSAEANLRDSEIELEDFKVNTITLPTEAAMPVVPGVENTRGAAFGNYFSLNVEKEELRRDREQVLRVLQAAAQDPSNIVTALEVIPAVQSASELRAALAQLTESRAELRALGQRYTAEYEPYQQLAEQVRVMETQTVPGLARTLATELRTREQEIDQMLASASSELRDIPTRSTDEARLERRVDINDALYTDLQRRYENARLAAVSNVPDVQVLDPASAPQSPVDDERPQLLLMLMAGALGLSVGLVFILDRTDRKVRYPTQVTHDLGLPILGAVPNITNGANGNEAAVEAFREVRHAISQAYGTAGPVTVAITSPEKGDGKSFVTANLALSFAGIRNQRVLVLDGDTRRGSLHRLFGVDRKPGLTDLLHGDHSLAEVMRPTDHEAVSFMPCGTRMTGGPELLASPAFTGLLADLKKQFDVILVDTPPLAAGIDAYVLGRSVGHVALVLRTGKTQREIAAAKLDVLDRVPLRLLGAVLNAVPNNRVYGYYSYSYGYLSNYEAGEEPVSAPRLTKA